MKKILLITLGVLGVAAIALGVAGFAYAQTQTPPPTTYPFGGGMMGGWGGYGAAMMGRWGGGFAPLHAYMINAFAEALDLTPEELQAQLAAGETMWSIAEAKGLSAAEFADLMLKARTQALNQAVADGVITQAQAEWMIQRMQQMQAAGFGPGNCPMHFGAGFGPGPAGRWNNR